MNTNAHHVYLKGVGKSELNSSRTFIDKDYLMKTRLLIVSAMAIALALQTSFIWADGTTDNRVLTTTAPTLDKTNAHLEDQEKIYGVQLMTPEERGAFRDKMSAAKTMEERDQIRDENHQAMRKRAQSHGLTLPDQVPAEKQGMSQGREMMDQSRDMGQGDGTGAGDGRSQ